MGIKKPKQDKIKKDRKSEIICPNCNTKINIADIGLVMFESCTVFSCPVCKKTIAIQPKGKEFEIKTMEE
jgi:Zn finger protein HypA/HybF involved in hydrogenase expression